MGSLFSKSPPPAPPSKPVPEVAKLTSLQQAKFDMKVRRDKLERISKQHLKEQKVRAPPLHPAPGQQRLPLPLHPFLFALLPPAPLALR